ncbi:TPA: hypothetical protein N0F65_004333 [Lagenidium giganteum]|uniref:Uncharacterized protein n=1 Tax=Lagenidium giganteum TaxID=4803 RepID=A0AAV2YIY4_9STRA|nr:TPA: hypothetical protein N0F65_004333 [Lagenidium giganteum]
MAPTEAAIMEFCSLDCKSSNEYVREVQEHINNVLLETPVPQSINVTATSSEDTNTDKPISF